MNIGQFLLKAKDLIAAARAGNYILAFQIALELIRAVTDNMAPAMFGIPRAFRSIPGFDPATADTDELLNQLESLCNSGPAQASGQVAAAQVTGPLIDNMMPILFALLRKFLGL